MKQIRETCEIDLDPASKVAYLGNEVWAEVARARSTAVWLHVPRLRDERALALMSSAWTNDDAR